jgi:hypothetical protein
MATDQEFADDIAQKQEAEANEPNERTSFLLVDFTDDHNIEHMRVQVRNVTPLQITAAIYYLQRAANRLADAAEYAQMQAQSQGESATLEVVRDIQAERRAANKRDN